MKSRRFFSMALALLLMTLMGTAAYAAEEAEGLVSLWIDASDETAESFADGQAADMIGWQQVGDQYYLFVPGSADLAALRLFFTADDAVTLEGTALVSGEVTDAFAAGGEFTLRCGEEAYSVVVQQTAEIASMFITTESGNLEYIHQVKGNAETAKALLVDADGVAAYNGSLDSIKGRGNVTWLAEKKPYNIKLSKSTKLLGMTKAKKWTLLSNPYDPSNIRNEIAYALGRDAGVEYTSDMRPIDLYINGEYKGLYFLAEKIELDSLVEIEDLEGATEDANGGADLESFGQLGQNAFERNTIKYYDIPNNPEDITGGYLLEYELSARYAAEASGFVTSRGQAAVLTSPEFASKAQVEYIRDFVQDMEDAIYSVTGYNEKGKHYSDYLDEESFAKIYVLKEFTMELDVGITSFYMYKDSDLTGDGKMHASCAWDFDKAWGTNEVRDGVDLQDPEKWWANQGRIYDSPEWTLHIIAALYQHVEFAELAIEQWYDVYVPLVDKLLREDSDTQADSLRWLWEYAEEIRSSIAADQVLWGSSDADSNIRSIEAFAEQRAAFLSREWSDPPLPTIVWPGTETSAYGVPLSEIPLVGGSTQYGTFEWTEGSLISAPGGSYSVTFTPNEATAKKYESITVAKKDIAVDSAPAPAPDPVPAEDPPTCWEKFAGFFVNLWECFAQLVTQSWNWFVGLF